MRRPDFLIVGAAKAGTTSLYHYLNHHPDIFLPKLKEPKYFSSKCIKFPQNGVGDTSVDKFRVRTLDSYLKLFDGRKEKLIGEASPEYLYYHQEVPAEILRELGDIPIIIILRNPVDRAFSAYSYLVRDQRENLPFSQALEEEEGRLGQGWDFIWAYKRAGLYAKQVKAYLENFSQVLVLTQEEMQRAPKDVIDNVFDFLNIQDKDISIDTSIIHNPSGTPKNLATRFLLSRSNPLSPVIREIAKALMPRKVLEKVAAKNLKRDHISDEDRKVLSDYFKEDIKRLETLLGRKIPFWHE